MIKNEQHLRECIQWHTDPVHGSALWTGIVESGITRDAILAWFMDGERPSGAPDLSWALRTLSAKDLIPRGLDQSEVVGIFESGGTTGSPKRVVLDRKWQRTLLDWSYEGLERYGITRGRSWLAAVPSGPHIVGHFIGQAGHEFGELPFFIDIDPRWSKAAAAEPRLAQAYREHIVSQIGNVLDTQDIGCLVTTPPILKELIKRDAWVDAIRERQIAVRWGGTPLAPEDWRFYRAELFTDVPFVGMYGNSISVSFGLETQGDTAEQGPCFEFCAEGVSVDVVGDDGSARAFGDRGRVAFAHWSRGFLYPPSIDRDIAVGIGPNRVAEPSSLLSVNGAQVVEGVY